MLLISVFWFAISCDPLENNYEREKEPESDPIDLIIGDYDMYVSLYVSYYTVGQSLSVTDTVDMRINKIASDAAELISDVVNTTATIATIPIIILFFIINSIPFSLRSKAHIGMKALSLKHFRYIIYLKGIHTTKHVGESCRLLQLSD